MHKVTVLHVHILQRCQHRNAVEPGNSVDAIHEIIGIHNPDKHHVSYHDGPPGIGSEYTCQVKRAAYCQQVEEQTHLLSQAIHVIPKAHPRDQRDAGKEPERSWGEMKQQEQQRRHPPDNAATSYGDVVVRAPLVRFVDDVEPIRDPEIKKFCCKQQNQDDQIDCYCTHVTL